MLSDEIKQAQAAYAARPFAVRWVDSHYSGTHRFHTFDEAFAYAQDQWARQVREVSRHRYRASALWQSAIITPAGSMPLRWYLLTADVSSYNVQE
jgi:hypothetical protein